MKSFLLFIVLILFIQSCTAPEPESQKEHEFRIIGYYSGPPELVDSFEINKLTHIIFSFGHLKGNKLDIGSAADSTTIQKMVAWKSKNPTLKVMLSLGGWTGCETCSDVFNTEVGRKEFAQSVRQLTDYFKTDGIDLDWEYPAIPGPPGHTYRSEDRPNVTKLLKEIREANVDSFEISFAAGGFKTFIDSSLEWKEAMKYMDFVNVMTYDLVHGYSKISGHHTPLYSTPQQEVSADTAIQLLLEKGVVPEKIVIGAAFYGRYFQIDSGASVDLYQPCHFIYGFPNHHREDSLKGFEILWDSVAQAPYALNQERRLLATYDDERSIALKTKYAKDNGLGGIMFWQLVDDKFRGGLLETIHQNK